MPLKLIANMKTWLYLFLFSFTVVACRQQQKDYTKFTNDPLVFCRTVKKLNNVVLENNFPPVVASRNYAYASIAAYECIAAGDSTYTSLAGQIKHLPNMPKAYKLPVDFHLAALLSFIKVGNAVTFPEGVLMEYYDEIKHKADSAGMPEEILNNSIAFADTISSVIMKWSKGDNYAQTRSAEKYIASTIEGAWIPTPPAYTPGMEPHWCDIRPNVMDSASQFNPSFVPKYDIKNTKSLYYKELMEVKKTVDSLTPEQKHIADFFDDNPFKLNVSGHLMLGTKKFSPPGHWMNIVGIAAEKSKADFNATVAAYAETAIAMFDAFIGCWKVKYQTNVVRPETVINLYFDPAWRPYIQTPPFPSYVSGHSVVSSAAAEIMTHHFGDHFAFTDTSEKEFGIASRSFQSFHDAALEASWSRLYGGIHYRSDLEHGNVMGKKIGEFVLQRLKMNKQTDKNLTAFKAR